MCLKKKGTINQLHIRVHTTEHPPQLMLNVNC